MTIPLTDTGYRNVQSAVLCDTSSMPSDPGRRRHPLAIVKGIGSDRKEQLTVFSD
jgi:hypothetical protein